MFDTGPKRLPAAAEELGDEHLQMLALLRTRALLLVAGGAPDGYLEASLAQAEELVARLDRVEGDGRTKALYWASNLERMQVYALGDDRFADKVARLERVLAWLWSDDRLLDPEGANALSFAVDIARELLDTAGPEQVTDAWAAASLLEDVFLQVALEHGGEAVEHQRSMLAGSRRRLDRRDAQQALIDAPAPDLGIVATVHAGEVVDGPVTWAELRGKVVLLEFWNVFCGPCIASFPWLAELERTHADDGLVVLGLTGFYGIGWDEEQQRPLQDAGATRKQELRMLARFAERHDAQHRLAVTGDDEVSRRYGVLAHPTAFLVDRQGIVRAAPVRRGPRRP